MRLCVALFFFAGLSSSSYAETSSPWFGSEASAPAQISFVSNTQQLIVSDEVLTEKIAMICPIEGCPTDANFGKLPK